MSPVLGRGPGGVFLAGSLRDGSPTTTCAIEGVGDGRETVGRPVMFVSRDWPRSCVPNYSLDSPDSRCLKSSGIRGVREEAPRI